jgi:hypothetical protein
MSMESIDVDGINRCRWNQLMLMESTDED